MYTWNTATSLSISNGYPGLSIGDENDTSVVGVDQTDNICSIKMITNDEWVANGFKPGGAVTVPREPDPETYLVHEVDIYVNASSDWSIGGSFLDVQGCFTHEFGHVLGLLDLYGDNGAMDSPEQGGVLKTRYLSQDDKNGLDAVINKLNNITGIVEELVFTSDYQSNGQTYNSTDFYLNSNYNTYYNFNDGGTGDHLTSITYSMSINSKNGVITCNPFPSNNHGLTIASLPTLTNGNGWVRNDAGNITGSLEITGVTQAGKSYSGSVPIQIMNGPRLTTNGALTTNEEWNEAVTLKGNVTVPTGETLTLDAGYLNINLNGYYIASAGGTINLGSGANVGNCAYLKGGNILLGLFPTIQSAANYYSAGGGGGSNFYTIELQPRTYNESVTFSGKSTMALDGLGSATINSCTVNNSEYIHIQNLTISGSAIQINGSNNTYIDNVNVTFGAGIVLEYNGTTTTFRDSYGTNGGAAEGFISYGGTGGSIRNNHISGWDIGIYLQNSANYYDISGNYFCGNGSDIYAISQAKASASDNQYSRSLPGAVYGSVTTSGSSIVCGHTKAAGKQIADGSATTESVTGGDDLLQQYFNLLQQMKTDKENGVVNTASYVETVGTIIGKLMVKFVTTFDKDSFKKNIVFLSQLYNTIGAKTDFNNALAILSGNKLFSNYLPFIKRYEIGTDIDNRDYKKAADLTNTIMADKNTDTGLLCEMLYEKGLIYKNYLNDTVTSKAAFTELAVNHSDNILSKFALAQLGQSGGGSLGKQAAAIAGTETTQKAITGFGNYPNPFNPTTKICYPVEQAGAIKLSVYNLLGQRVAELVNCYMEKGNYTVDFDGSKLASGLYIYTLQAGNKFTSRKMFLLK